MNTALLLCVLLPYAVADYSIDKVTVGEGDGTVQFIISFNPTADWFMKVVTEDVTATAGTDYTALTQLYNGLQAASSVTVSVAITDDSDYEATPETFKIRIESASNIADTLTFFTITITENDVIDVQVGVDSVKMLEEYVGNVDVIFKRLDSTTHAFSFAYSFVDGSATIVSDLTAAIGSVSFNQNENTKTVTAMFAVVDDKDDEGDETFTLALTGSEIIPVNVAYTIKDNDAVINVHCRRMGQGCENSAVCNVLDGTCQCQDNTRFGPLCEIETAKVDGAGCPLECGDNGQCIGGTTAACKCNPGWSGNKCQYKSYYAQCNPNNFGICISPYNLAMFTGKIYIKGQEATAACNLNLITTPMAGVPDWCNGYGAVVPYLNDVCGQPTTAMNVNGMTTYEVIFRVQYDQASKQATDEIVTLICQYDATGMFVVPGGVFSLSSGSIDQSGSPNGGTTNFSPASQSLLSANGSPVTGSVEIGKMIKVCVTVNGVDAFGSITVIKIILDNNIDDINDVNYHKVEIYALGCKSTTNNYLVVMPFYEPNTLKHTVCYQIQAIAFTVDTRSEKFLRIQTEVQGFPGANDATLAVCGARRKRQANNKNSTAELQTVIKLVLPESVQLQSADSACSREWLMPAMIGVSIISITMAVIIMILVFTVVKKFRTKQMA